MTEITILNDVTVELVESMGSDKSIVQAAQVSVVGANNPENFERDAGLINYLMREHHGSPFEHNSMTFYVKAPIFVFREFHRHRVGFSYNEMSGRYTQLPPEFYVPNADRPLKNVGSSSRPEFEKSDDLQIQGVQALIPATYQIAWDSYEAMLEDGVANEVARMVLPVGVMSQMYVTTNLRALLNFLTLRTKGHENAAWKSRPQHEISMVADKMEQVANVLFPIAMQKYNDNGRVAP